MTKALAASTAEIRTDVRRGLAVFFALVVVLWGTVEAIWSLNPEMSILVIPLMWNPAVASIITRLIFKEDFSDVSFRFGGLRTLPWYALGLAVPTVVGLLAFGTAWLTELVGPLYSSARPPRCFARKRSAAA